jgi:hypothetical protein
MNMQRLLIGSSRPKAWMMVVLTNTAKYEDEDDDERDEEV